MSKNTTIEDRKAALTAWLNRKAGNPSDTTFEIKSSHNQDDVFEVDLNGTGQCIGEFFVFTEEEAHYIKYTFDRNLDKNDLIEFKGVSFVVYAL